MAEYLGDTCKKCERYSICAIRIKGLNWDIYECKDFKDKDEDRVKVVRCKNCRHWNKSKMDNSSMLMEPMCPCMIFSNIEASRYTHTSETAFCSFGEKREE